MLKRDCEDRCIEKASQDLLYKESREREGWGHRKWGTDSFEK